MNHLIRPAIFDHHNQARIGHDQRIGLHANHRFNVTHIGVDFTVVRRDIAGDVKLFAQLVGATNAIGEIVEGEIVVAYAQAVTWLAGVNGIGTIGKGVFHVAYGACGGK